MKSLTEFMCPQCGWKFSPALGYRTPQHYCGKLKGPTSIIPPDIQALWKCQGSDRAAIVEGPNYAAN